jgi:hypothetical protein
MRWLLTKVTQVCTIIEILRVLTTLNNRWCVVLHDEPLGHPREISPYGVMTGIRGPGAADRSILGLASRLPGVAPGFLRRRLYRLNSRGPNAWRAGSPGRGRHPFEADEAAHVVDEVRHSDFAPRARTMSSAPMPFFLWLRCKFSESKRRNAREHEAGSCSENCIPGFGRPVVFGESELAELASQIWTV